jgi:protein phosphatase
MTTLRAASHTDIGKIRKENEDRFLLDEAAGVFGVADGVGGLPGGGEAAQEAIEIVGAALRQLPADAVPDLRAIVTAANESVVALGTRISPGLGIGSTLTLGCVRGSQLKLAHVGDSRAFVLRNGHFECLTEDHSVENEARRRRARGEIVYYSESQRGALTRCLGQLLAPEVDLSDLTLSAGDRYLFCTDGVTRMVTEKELGQVLERASEPLQAARGLVDLAVERGGPDNATVVALFVDSV